MKKKLSLLLILALLLSLCACANAPDAPATEAPSLPVQTQQPTEAPTQAPTQAPTDAPTEAPTTPPTEPTQAPTQAPTEAPTMPPTAAPTEAPTAPPTEAPTDAPTVPPTEAPTEAPTEPPTEAPTEPALDPNGSYTSKDDVALYLHLYGKLPPNFMTKSQARQLGWKSGSLERYAPGKCIGGDVFQNREGLLPKASGRTYYECDIGTMGSTGGRGSKRIVYSNDGLIYYTSDHYRSFTLLYGEP